MEVGTLALFWCSSPIRQHFWHRCISYDGVQHIGRRFANCPEVLNSPCSGCRSVWECHPTCRPLHTCMRWIGLFQGRRRLFSHLDHGPASACR